MMSKLPRTLARAREMRQAKCRQRSTETAEPMAQCMVQTGMLDGQVGGTGHWPRPLTDCCAATALFGRTLADLGWNGAS